MNTYSIKKHTLPIKKRTRNRITGLMFSFAYGLFIVGVLKVQFQLGSGDIGQYVFSYRDPNAVEEISGFDYAFRYAVFVLSDIFNQTPMVVLTCMAFVISSAIFYINARNIRSQKYLIYILPLFLLMFFTPRVAFLFSSGIRSGIAFVVLMTALIYFKGVSRYILFGLSSIIHVSMLPLISLYLLFNILKTKRIKSLYNKRIKSPFIKSPFIVPLFLLLLFSFFIAIFGGIFQPSAQGVQSSIFYNLLIFYFALLIIFINKKAMTDLYGFMSVGAILIVLSGVIVDVSFLRYIGNAMLLYLLFLINKGEVGTIKVFTIAYTPFFVLTFYYAMANLLNTV